MFNFKYNKQRAFTIVELLIVIVILGLLATLVIVTYTGIQSRARNAIISIKFKEYNKALSAYFIDYGTYPITGDTIACLGRNYQDTDNNGSGDCGLPAFGFLHGVEYDAVNDALAPYLKTNAQSEEDVDFSGYTYNGILLAHTTQSRTVDGVQAPYWMFFFLLGNNENCKANVVRGTNGVYTTGNYPWSINDTTNKITWCTVHIEQP